MNRCYDSILNITSSGSSGSKVRIKPIPSLGFHHEASMRGGGVGGVGGGQRGRRGRGPGSDYNNRAGGLDRTRSAFAGRDGDSELTMGDLAYQAYDLPRASGVDGGPADRSVLKNNGKNACIVSFRCRQGL